MGSWWARAGCLGFVDSSFLHAVSSTSVAHGGGFQPLHQCWTVCTIGPWGKCGLDGFPSPFECSQAPDSKPCRVRWAKGLLGGSLQLETGSSLQIVV